MIHADVPTSGPRVHETIADLDATIRMNRDAGDLDEIKLNREAWRLLCELGAGASVAAIAERLGTTEFWIAKVAAELTERQLLVLGEGWSEQPATEPALPAAIEEPAAPADSWWVEPQDEAPAEIEADAGDQPVFEVTSPGGFRASRGEASSPSLRRPRKAASDTLSGRMSRMSLSPTAMRPSPRQPTAAIRRSHTPRPPTLETPVEPDVEGDTEAFLEKVFSQLEVNGKADVEEEGHGLLRRRRMGSVLKEIDEG